MISIFMLLGLTFLGLAMAPNILGENAAEDDDADEVEIAEAQETSAPNLLDSIFDSANDLTPDEVETRGGDVTIAAPNLIQGTSHDDALLGTEMDDEIVGGQGDDLLQGGDGDDILDGASNENEQDADYLRGGNGNDTLIGNGLDRMNGGTGSDTFVVANVTDNAEPVRIDDYDDETDYIVIRHSSSEPPPSITTQLTDSATIILANEHPIAILEGVRLFDPQSVAFVIR